MRYILKTIRRKDQSELAQFSHTACGTSGQKSRLGWHKKSKVRIHPSAIVVAAIVYLLTEQKFVT